MESWLSGRKQQFTKLPNLYRFQGFESLTLRKISLLPETALARSFLLWMDCGAIPTSGLGGIWL